MRPLLRKRKERAQWRGSETKARRDAIHASPAEGVGAAISAWAAEGRRRVLDQELTKAEVACESGERRKGTRTHRMGEIHGLEAS